MTIKLKFPLLSLAAVGLLTTAPMALHAEQSDWIFRLGGAWMNPKSENQQPVLAGTPDVSTLVVDQGLAVAGDITYMFSPHFGVEGWLHWPFELGIDLKPYSGGESRIGETEVLSPTLSLVWQFLPEAKTFRPYIGVGANWTTFSSENLRSGGLADVGLPANTKLSLDDSFGVAAHAGVDIRASRNWFLNLNVRWIDIEADSELRSNTFGRVNAGTVDLDPVVIGAALTYRFAGPEPLPEPAAAPAPPPPPPPPPPPAKCADSDNDGVCDVDDKCPNTPAGTRVDRVGCPIEQTLKVLFDFDSAELRPESITELERVVRFMNDVPFATALVEGHTDSVGTEEYNQALSDRRAKSVFDYLTSRGVDPARLKSIGHGELKPIADNETAEGRQQNRRVMLIRTDTK